MERQERTNTVVGAVIGIVTTLVGTWIGGQRANMLWLLVLVLGVVFVLMLWERWPRWTKIGIVWDWSRDEETRSSLGPDRKAYDRVICISAQGRTLQPVDLRLTLPSPASPDLFPIPTSFTSADGEHKQIQAGEGPRIKIKGHNIRIRYSVPPLHEGDKLRVYLHRGEIPTKVQRRD